MLDILEKFLIRKGYCFSRFDGTTPMNFGGCGFLVLLSNKILKAIVDLSG
jgi:hypothetical protein